MIFMRQRRMELFPSLDVGGVLLQHKGDHPIYGVHIRETFLENGLRERVSDYTRRRKIDPR